MRSHTVSPRTDWTTGLAPTFLSCLESSNYWAEELDTPWYIELTESESQRLQVATSSFVKMVEQAVDYVINGPDFEEIMNRLGIPLAYHRAVRDSWHYDDRTVVGRFDVSYDGFEAKLLETSFDVPGGMYEASWIQREWLAHHRGTDPRFAHVRQHNDLDALLIARLRSLDIPYLHIAAQANCPEDEVIGRYIERCANQAGINTYWVYLEDIGIADNGDLCDLDNYRIDYLFKVFPWERVIEQDLAYYRDTGRYFLLDKILERSVTIYEPLWKVVANSKGILPILWELFPESELLLPARFARDPAAETLARSPHARKGYGGNNGSQVTLVIDPTQSHLTVEATERCEDDRAVVQQLQQLPTFHGRHLLLDSWVVGSEPAAFAFRASTGPKTDESAIYVPHVVV
jgi:glutathionylspermidine synthase